MRIIEAEIPDIKIICTERHADARGSFSETYHQLKFAGLGVSADFVQDNHSVSVCPGTVRGLHFQKPPFAQAKLVRVLRGAILDVAVDLRQASPTFGQHVCVRLSAENCNQLFVPTGFAHGFCTLVPDTEVLYKVSNFYAPEHDSGVLWDDPDLRIDWPVQRDAAVLSDKDTRLPRFRDIAACLPF
jgi:dTDP-4-dehydrorhamnose 3,5-epimerase